MEGVRRSAQATCTYVSTIAVCVHVSHGHVSLGTHTGCACVCTRTQGCTHVSAHASMPWYTQERSPDRTAGALPQTQLCPQCVRTRAPWGFLPLIVPTSVSQTQLASWESEVLCKDLS